MSSPDRPQGPDTADTAAAAAAAADSCRPTTPQASSAPSLRPAAMPPANLLPANDTRRCFVCLTDEPERKLPRDWSTPCKCSLEGHHECLLDWIADLESQQKPIQCPQCKAKVRLIEQWDPLVHLSDYLNKLLTTWSPTVLVSFVASGALIGSALYGIEAIEIFAGPEAATQFIIKEVPIQVDGIEGYFREMLDLSTGPAPSINFAHFSCLPFIGPALILNRLDFGAIFTVPASLVAISWSGLADPETTRAFWPPTFEQAMLIVPSIKTAYFLLYKTFFCNMEKRWERIARAPHLYADGANRVGAAQGNAAGGNNQNGAAEAEFGGIQFQAEINFNLGGGGVQENEINPEDNVGDVPQPAHAAGGGNGGADGWGLEGRHQGFDLGEKSPFNFVAGALMFPAVCYGAGEILRALLPSRLVTKPFIGPATGLLQERWGRSLVGGCLFVVLKDAFFLYVKYRRALIRPMRKIQNATNRNVRR